MRCPICNCPLALEKLAELDIADLFGLKSIVVQNVPAFVCPNGHEPILPGGLIDEIGRRIVVEILTSSFALCGMEVRFLRKSMAMTQQAVADLLGVDRVTVARWEGLEHGTVDVPVSIALRTVLGSSERSPVKASAADPAKYQRPPAPHPDRMSFAAPAQSSAMGF